jgi:hypothetical protein
VVRETKSHIAYTECPRAVSRFPLLNPKGLGLARCASNAPRLTGKVLTREPLPGRVKDNIHFHFHLALLWLRPCQLSPYSGFESGKG